MARSEPEIIPDISKIIDYYDIFFIDLWGVIHNGVNLFPGVNNVLKVMKKNEKTIFFITNAPRRASVISRQLKKFGIDNSLYDRIVSSGEITWHSLKKKISASNYHLRLKI